MSIARTQRAPTARHSSNALKMGSMLATTLAWRAPAAPPQPRSSFRFATRRRSPATRPPTSAMRTSSQALWCPSLTPAGAPRRTSTRRCSTQSSARRTRRPTLASTTMRRWPTLQLALRRSLRALYLATARGSAKWRRCCRSRGRKHHLRGVAGSELGCRQAVLRCVWHLSPHAGTLLGGAALLAALRRYQESSRHKEMDA